VTAPHATNQAGRTTFMKTDQEYFPAWPYERKSPDQWKAMALALAITWQVTMPRIGRRRRT